MKHGALRRWRHTKEVEHLAYKGLQIASTPKLSRRPGARQLSQLGSAGRMLRALVHSHTHLLCAAHTHLIAIRSMWWCPVTAAYPDAS